MQRALHGGLERGDREDFPRDPMDRLIAATARSLRIPLVTRDERLIDSPLVETVW